MTEKTKNNDKVSLASDNTPSTLGDYAERYWTQIKSGNLGPLPIIIGLVFIAIYFQTQNENFLTPRNFVNLIVQMAGLTTIAYGVVFVLLLGEIDLSIGYVSGVCAVTMTLLLGQTVSGPFAGFFAEGATWPWWLVIPTALLVVSAIGFAQGAIIAYLKVPSFVVTLAGFLGWNGVVLLLIGGSGTVIIQSSFVTGIANSYLTPIQGWIVAAITVLVYVGREYFYFTRRRAENLSTTPIAITIVKVIGLSALAASIVLVVNQDRGVPVVGVILLVLLAFFSFIAQETQFGRFVYAVGGNEEASRRAGIKVNQIRIAVFTLSSFMAGMGGIILASRLRSVATNTGGGNLLLNAIAAAVIGGTSLFGGRGAVYSAVLGAAVIASVENGMGLLNVSSGVKFIVTGIVLLIAVIVDSLSRRQQAASSS